MTSTKPKLRDLLKKRILLIDSAMGTALQTKNLTPKDFGGESYEGCFEKLNLSKPEVIRSIHEENLKVGCDILETNTFGATPLVLEEYGLASATHEINYEAAKLARKIADAYSTPEKPRYVAGSIGPTTKAITVTGGASFSEMVDHFYAQVKGLALGGVDYFLLETCQDTRNIKAALKAIDQLNEKRGNSNLTTLDVAVSVTIEPMGTMLAGQTIEALYAAVEHKDLLYLGLNCATGPEFMTDHIRSLSKISKFPVACVPNAGLPDEDGTYLETPKMMAEVLERFLNHKWINLLGGCCGTTPKHMEAFLEISKKAPPRPMNTQKFHMLSGIDALEITEEMRPVIVGERTNVIGSRKFKTLICEEKFEEASEIARAQIKKGAQIIDVCLANPDRDEMHDMKNFLSHVIKKIKAPLMIDSTDASVIEEALTYSQGKAIINSINLEDGEERFEKVVPMAQKQGAALVVGTIDDDPKQGMGITRQRKLEIAKRSYQLLTQKYNVPEENIYWDPLVFPCATGDAQYVGSAQETIEGIRLIKKEFPNTKTILGVSNVSFGLPTSGREVLNSVFLYECVKAGLDLAIVNSEKLIRYGAISKEEIQLAEDLLYNRGTDPITNFANHFRTQKPKSNLPKEILPLDQRLSNYILEGSKDGLTQDLDEALQTQKPLDIINGPLMRGMDEVGRLFNKNEMIVAEVLQSAEAMKASVRHLEPHMEKKDTQSRGKVLLATVKGDVHDIGKNLVEIILSNNGFEVINLGIKVPPEVLIQNAKKHNPHMIGLSGLLVKSAQQMVVTAEDFSKAKIQIPLLVGGAALSSKFVDQKISKAYTGTVIYAQDAMHGLELAKTVIDATRFKKLQTELAEKRKADVIQKSKDEGSQSHPSEARHPSPREGSQVRILPKVPNPPDYKRHVLRYTQVDEIIPFINPMMLYTRHLGIKGPVAKELQKTNSHPELRVKLRNEATKALEIYDAVQEVKETYKRSDVLRPAAMYQFFKAQSEKNKLHVYAAPKDKKPIYTFTFPRQTKEPYLCMSDYVHPENDSICMMATTMGKNLKKEADRLKDKGDYLKSHILQALAVEGAEAYAEFLHKQVRRMWGIQDAEDLSLEHIFQARYTGKRFSFGYPACPELEDQKLLFDILKPGDIGIELTEGYMMDPEASVSALILHHPDAKYFSV